MWSSHSSNSSSKQEYLIFYSLKWCVKASGALWMNRWWGWAEGLILIEGRLIVLDADLKNNKHRGNLDNSHCTVELRFFKSPMWSSLPSCSCAWSLPISALTHLFINSATSHRRLQKHLIVLWIRCQHSLVWLSTDSSSVAPHKNNTHKKVDLKVSVFVHNVISSAVIVPIVLL